MRVNVKTVQDATHEGAPAKTPNAADQLRRSVMACMLWEDEFYESGENIAERIRKLVAATDPTVCMEIAVEARHKMKLRHVPLLIVREMARLSGHKSLVAHALEMVIERADEIAEFLAIYWKDGRQPVSAQVKKGLARAFNKFNEYQFAKYDRDGAVKLRDALFLCHAKPADGVKRYTKLERRENKRRKFSDGEILFRKIVDGKLETPDTWEVALSGGADKKATFERLIVDQKLGALALLRNLRNMAEARVDPGLVEMALLGMSAERVLPFRFIAAARHAPQWEHMIEPAMLRCLEGREKLAGDTAILVDVSGSMDSRISAKSDLMRLDAACGLAMLARELCEEVTIVTFSDNVVQVPARRGFALRDAIVHSQPHGGTELGKAVKAISDYDRLIVLTDEQSHDAVPNPARGEGWIINVASNEHGIGYGAWNRVDGWSESVFDYIQARA